MRFIWPKCYSLFLIKQIALPKIELFTELAYVIRTYPAPTTLRETLLDHVYERLTYTLPRAPGAVRMRITRVLDTYADSAPQAIKRQEAKKNAGRFDSEAFVDALHGANEEFVRSVRAMGHSSGIAQAYAEFVEEWCSRPIDENLV